MVITLHVLQSVFNIALPFGFTFGMMVVTIWSLPMILSLIRKIF